MNGARSASVCMGMITVDFSSMTGAVLKCITALSLTQTQTAASNEALICSSVYSGENAAAQARKTNIHLDGWFYCFS